MERARRPHTQYHVRARPFTGSGPGFGTTAAPLFLCAIRTAESPRAAQMWLSALPGYAQTSNKPSCWPVVPQASFLRRVAAGLLWTAAAVAAAASFSISGAAAGLLRNVFSAWVAAVLRASLAPLGPPLLPDTEFYGPGLPGTLPARCAAIDRRIVLFACFLIVVFVERTVCRAPFLAAAACFMGAVVGRSAGGNRERQCWKL